MRQLNRLLFLCRKMGDIMKYHIFNEWLYKGKKYIGYIRYIDYRDNGNYGYGISRVNDYSLLEEFECETDRLFPDAENPYIEYLDMIYEK